MNIPHMKNPPRIYKIWKFKGIAKVDDNIVAESEFTAMMVDPDKG